MKLSFIGTGNMGGAILRAVCTEFSPADVCISNRSYEKSAALAAELGCRAAKSNPECVQGADFVFLGVKPNMIAAVLAEIAPALGENAVLVSMAAGVSGDAMRDALGDKSCAPLIRILPNTPCAVGRGLILVAPCGEVPAETLDTLKTLLAPCGLVKDTDEAHADAGMVVGGCTPASTDRFIEALADGGVRCGLPRADALAWAAQAVAGAAELLLQSGQHPGALKDAVCSPGGSTIEGVRALENAAFRGAVMDAVSAAFFKDWNHGK